LAKVWWLPFLGTGCRLEYFEDNFTIS